MAIAHSRYSTNTLPAFERVQPFGRLAHNGEINTIRRLRLELPGLGAQPLRGASDTQDLDLLVGVLLDRGLALDEVLAMLLPPVQPRGPLDRYHRAVCGPLAQGPAALIGRSGELVVGAVDRLGLRPLWQLRTPGELWLSSEPGVLDIGELDDDPVPVAAGQRVLIDLRRPRGFRSPSRSSPLAGVALASRFTRPRVPLRVAGTVDAAGARVHARRPGDAGGDGRHRRGADRVARVRRPAGRAGRGADRVRPLQAGGGRRHQPGHRP